MVFHQEVIMQNVLTLMQDRQSARMPFEAEHPIAQQDLRQILEAGRWAPTAHNMQNFQIIVVDDKDLLQAIGNIKHAVSDTFLQENYQQLSFSEEELRHKKVGLLASMFPPAWRTPGARQGEATAEVMSRPIPPCSALLVVVYDPRKRAPDSEGDVLGMMSLGCVMENMWLMAQSLGIGFQIMSALGAGPVEEEVNSILNIPDDLKIAFAVRLGYPIPSSVKYLRVRREVEDFTHHNRFGNKGIE
jgi:nitroreductase